MNFAEKEGRSIEEELNILFSVFEKMKQAGLIEGTRTNFDICFTSNKKGNLEKLEIEISKEFSYKRYYLKLIQLFTNEYELSIELKDIIMHIDLLVYLLTYLRSLSLSNNCILGDWGALIKNITIDSENKDSKWFNTKGYEYYENNLKYKSLVSFFISSTFDNNAESNYNIAKLLYEIKYVKLSIKYFTKAIEKNSEHPMPYLNRGVAYYDMEEYQNAVNDYNKILELVPDDQNALINLGNAYIRLKDTDNAISYYNKAIELGSKDAITAKKIGLELLKNTM